MRKFIRLLVWISALAFFSASAFANTPPLKAERPEFISPFMYEKQAEKEYLNIFSTFLTTPKSIWPDVEAYRKIMTELTIVKYKKFLGKYPWSHLVDEVLLRIAEFYSVMLEKKKARVWLDNIITKYPFDDYRGIRVFYNKKGNKYTGFKLGRPTGKTAAWALYYRAAWFPQSPTRIGDLKRILKDYQGSTKAVRLAIKLLRKLEKRGRKNE